MSAIGEMIQDWPDTRFVELLGSWLPIVAAPMAGAGGVELAAAVLLGGVGSLPCAMLSPDMVRAQVLEVRARCAGPLNLNFLCHPVPRGIDERAWRALLEPYYGQYGIDPAASGDAVRQPFDEAMCAIVEEMRPELVSFHFGLPADFLLDRVRAARCRILATATSIEEARRLAARGIDAIVAQGWEAGGHAGRFLGGKPEEHMGLLALLPQIVDATGLPVIAAGGISDGRGIAAAFMLGAAAVQIGTAYLRSPESLAGPAHRAALDSADAERTIFTNLFSGGLARGLPTRLTEELGAVRAEAPPFPLAAGALAPIAKEAARRGDAGFAPMWSGQAARLAPALAARELTETLGRDALALLRGRA
jgi:nitronate monooxygenase